MRLRVFGSNTDDKGSQLEELSRRLLQHLGYTRLALNVVGSGGNEIDVRGDFPIPSPAGETSVRLLGECKAYESPIGIPDWLKFLGKIYSEEARHPGQVRGLMVALSGANGNVRGAVDELRVHRATVDLIDGEQLVELLREVCGIPSLSDAALKARQLSTTPVAEFSLGYYAGEAFWVLHFSSGAFALLVGPDLDERPRQELVDLAKQQLRASEYRDLFKEKEYRERLQATRKMILSRLVAGLAPVSRSALMDPEGDFSTTEDEVNAAIAALTSEGLISVVDDTVALSEIEANDQTLTSVLREITERTLFLSVVGSDGWLALINERLLSAVSRLQGDLSIPSEFEAECLALLRWSPTALAWALRPDAMLVEHRKTAPERVQTETDDLRYFRLQLLRYAVQDFMHGPFARVHFENLDLRELEFRRHAIFKSSSRVELEIELTERVATARTVPELGGSVAKIWVHEKAPEPWAWPGRTPEDAAEASASPDSEKDAMPSTPTSALGRAPASPSLLRSRVSRNTVGQPQPRGNGEGDVRGRDGERR